MGYQYRDVAYIPIAVWRGVRQTNVQPQIDKEGSPVGAVQLIAPQMMAFGQFGVAQQLPITAALFKTLTWQITFWKMERGRMRHSRARHPA